MSAVVVAAAGFLTWVPAVEPGAMGIIVVVGIAIGSAGYAGAMQRLCARDGWAESEAVARSAQRWMLVSAAAMTLAVLALVVFVPAGSPDPASSFTTSVIFGRPVGGAGAGVGYAATFVLWIVATIRLRKASQLTRHALREQRDRELVGG